MPTPLKLVHPTAERISLRIYWYGPPDCREGWTYHNAIRQLRIAPYELVEWEPGVTVVKPPPEKPPDFPDPGQWPPSCEKCGTPVPPGHFLENGPGAGTGPGIPFYQVFQKTLYDDPPRDLAPGDCWDAWWIGGSPDQGRLAIMLPDGSMWTNHEATNCPHGHPGGSHVCWTVTGTPPKVTVRASIDTGRWHGFVTDGIAEP